MRWRRRLGIALLATAALWWSRAPTGRAIAISTGEGTRGGCQWLEQAIVLPTAALARPLGLDPTGETRGVAFALARAAPEVRRLPSVWTASLREEEVALEIQPPTGDPSAAVVFLHGYGGAFTWPCAQVAQAAAAVGATTLCPTLSAEGRWWEAQGRARLRATLDRVEERGLEPVFLVGLSNGAIGAASLAPRVEHRIAGLVLISGGTAPALRVPVLVIHGSHDRMAGTPAGRSQGIERALWPSDHFLLLRERAAVTARLADWLVRHR